MVMAGHSERAVSLRLEALEMQKMSRQEKQVERWNVIQMAKEDRRSRHQHKCEAVVCQFASRMYSSQPSKNSAPKSSRKKEPLAHVQQAVQKLLDNFLRHD